MSTVETPYRESTVSSNGRDDLLTSSLLGGLRRPGDDRLLWGLAITAVLALAFGLRVWGTGHGLPYAYNADENAHFVTRAIGLFGHDGNPHYFSNPPAYTYLAHIVLSIWYGGRAGVSNAFAADPTEIWVIGRVLAAILGTLAVWLLYLAGSRLLDRRVGLLAAGLFAVSFLPVFYSKLALNDVPTLAGVCLALWGAAGVLRFGRLRDYLVAGIGLGLACATKYTGGIVLLPLVAGASAQFAAAGGKTPALRGLGIACVAAFVTFVICNPYSLLDFSAFKDGLTHQSDASGDAAGKLGLTQENGYVYYLWSLGWGMGWLPLVVAVGAAVRLWFDEARLVWFLVPGVIVFILFMGWQARYFGRWVMPVMPMVCILAAYGAIELVDWSTRRMPLLKPTFMAAAVVALCGQGFVYSLHSGLVLSREDTRNLTREWMVANVPLGTKIVVEPVVPDQWAQDLGNPSPVVANGNRWVKYPTSRSNINPRTGKPMTGPGAVVNIEDFEKVLRPELVDAYQRQGYCWVVVGSTQRGRAEAEPQQVPGAIAYYKALEQRSRVAHVVSPYSKGEGHVGFNFDWTFNYYPLAYNRPGPEMTIYRLHGGQCTPN
ncbi:MAG TPA: glycosyltransferase family 39 protein [Solirubrobacteraceae bacterium]